MMFENLSPRTKKVVLILGVLLPLFFAQANLQKSLNAYQVNQKESFLYLPSGEYLKPLVLGYNQVVGDLLWIQAVHYFGSQDMGDKDYRWLYHILTLIIDLDPRFDFPYYFGGIVLSIEADEKNHANDILARGMEAYPEKWEYPFYIGFNHYYHDENPSAAIPYIEKAATLPKAPGFVKSLVGTLYSKTGRKKTALDFYRKTYKNTNDEMLRRKLSIKIENLLSEGLRSNVGD